MNDLPATTIHEKRDVRVYKCYIINRSESVFIRAAISHLRWLKIIIQVTLLQYETALNIYYCDKSFVHQNFNVQTTRTVRSVTLKNQLNSSDFLPTASRRMQCGTCINHLTPNGHYMGRTAQLTSRCCILYIYSTNIRTEYFKHAA